MSKSIALIGNPNCGKTTLFNQLTGANQSVGNWPGVTVLQEQRSYVDPFTGHKVNVVDLPGCYSLVASIDTPHDEKLSCEYVTHTRNILYLYVMDVTHMARDLYLLLQLLEQKLPVIVAINCMDLAKSAGVSVDVEQFSNCLGCPVVPITAKSGAGILELKEIISKFNLTNNYEFDIPEELQKITNLCGNNNIGQTLRLLEGDTLLANNFCAELDKVKEQLSQSLELDIFIASQRRQRLQRILQTSCKYGVTKAKISETIDNFTLHKIYGPIIFLGVMYLMFTCAINLGGILQVWVEQLSSQIFVINTSNWLQNIGASNWIVTLLSEGLGRGINITITFAPVLAAMFLCLGILENSGYMTRAAFIVDRLMRNLGLSGRAFVPMIVGFGCNVPAVLGTRCLISQRERILTIIMTPFMSCSARLAIYAIFVANFFPIGGQNVIFSLYVIGVSVAILTALVLRNSVATDNESISIMEMPEYKWPALGELFRQVWFRLQSFLLKAGTLIVLLCVAINGIGSDNLATLGKTITPLFAPIGISTNNWPATVSLITGLIAKEAVVGTLNAFYVNDVTMIQSFGSQIAAYSYLLFTLLYFPCVSVVAAISKELNFKWAMFSVFWSTGIAYILAAIFYQVATMNSWILIVSLFLGLGGFFVFARWIARNTDNHQRRVPTIITIS